MRHCFLLVLLTLSLRAPLAGQWTVAAELGVSRFGGTARDTATAADPPAARPSPGVTLGLRLERQVGRLGVGLGVLWAGTGLVVEGDEAAVTAKDAATLVEVAADVSLRVAASAVGTSVRLHAGPLVAVWLPKEDDARTRGGVHAAVSLIFPLAQGSRLTGSVRAGGALTASMLDSGEPPPEYARRATSRGGVSLGLRYRL